MEEEFLPSQGEHEARLTFALYSGLRSETVEERNQWGTVADVLSLSCSSIEIEFAKMSALGTWIEEMGIDPDTIPDLDYE